MSSPDPYVSGYRRLDADLYSTEPRATVACLRHVKLRGPVYECCCGRGDMVQVLKSFGYAVAASDLNDQGFGRTGVDMLTAPLPKVRGQVCRTVFTNPPYDVRGPDDEVLINAEKAVRRALALTEPVGGMVVMLLGHQFDAAPGRADLFEGAPFVAKLNLPFRPFWDSHLAPNSNAKDRSPKKPFGFFYWDWLIDAPGRLIMIPPDGGQLRYPLRFFQ